MKRLVALAALLLLPLWGCTQPAEAPANVTTTNANATTTASPATATVSEATITDQEKQVWDALKRKDNAAFGNLLADNFVYVSSDNITDKAGTINGTKDFNPTDVTLSDWKFVPIDKDAAVITYKTAVKGTSGGKSLPATSSRASSIWVNRGGKWVAIFHQDTDVKEAQATQPTLPGEPAKPKAPPPAPTVPPSTTEPVAVMKEKAVWDALRRKDFDGFASFLASDSVEVEENGVFDKAGSVKGVKGFDFTDAQLSDFKTVDLDKDASIVTYLVKIPGGNKAGERHATLWVNRNGSWLALWHQGTPVMPAPPAK